MQHKDILEGKNLKIQCLDRGHCILIDCMPRLVPEGQTADYRIVQAARVSYGDGTKTVNEDRGLIRYLMRHAHSSPTEKIRFEFHIKAPLFVFGQLVR
jgi:thymidylate synthase (FAD)